MDAGENAKTELSWRKRHPVVSRLFLYVLGVGVMVLLVHLFLERQEIDELDRQHALALQLDGMGTVLIMDPDGSHVLKILDEKFSDETLPVKTRGRVLRWRALALRKRPDFAGAEAALKQAAALALEPLERAALHLEWAETKLEEGDPKGAMGVLVDAEIPCEPVPMGLLRDLLLARAEELADDHCDGLSRLERGLAALRAPLDRDHTIHVGGRDWTTAQLASVATEGLVRLPGYARPADAWRRLARLAADDYDAQILCALSLLDLGVTQDARAAWDRARSLDARLAALEAARRPALSALGD